MNVIIQIKLIIMTSLFDDLNFINQILVDFVHFNFLVHSIKSMKFFTDDTHWSEPIKWHTPEEAELLESIRLYQELSHFWKWLSTVVRLPKDDHCVLVEERLPGKITLDACDLLGALTNDAKENDWVCGPVRCCY